ncbi:MAG: hypothetical protein JRH07_16685 [Deltaproteobacteria bacterium]|nr:hypothetical protein [Deltaproteobacteria bacterium]MBW2123457.1 hypothetical protein [Deltaproteobacteria bacterium]
MRKRGIWRVVAVVSVLVLLTSAVGFALETTAEDQMVVPDLLLGKPLGLISLGMGALTYVITLPVTVPFGWRAKAAETLVKKPYRWTFQRGLGEDLKKP